MPGRQALRRGLAALASVVAVAAVLVAPAYAPQAAEGQPTAQQVRGLAESPGERGTITWYPCQDDSWAGWECGSLTVPLNWFDKANPANAEIAMAIKRSTAPDRIGAFTFNPGGPGGSGLGSALRIRELLPTEIRDRFDFVAWDPRGVGKSSPKLSGCPPEPDGPDLPATGSVDWAALIPPYIEELTKARAACYAANEDLAPYLGTDYVIRDLEALRIALGEEQWTYWGMSYGTRIGLRYSRAFPTRFRAFLLDGSVSPNETMISRSGQTAYKYAHVNAAFAGAVGGGMGVKLARVVSGMNDDTILINGRSIDRWRVFGNIYSNMGRQSNYPWIRKLIDEVYDALYGGPVDETGFRRALKRLSESDDGSQTYFIDMVNCADAQPWPTTDQVVRMVATASVTSSYTGSRDSLGRSTHCFGLPTDIAPPWRPIVSPLVRKVPPIVIQAYGDPATGWVGGRMMSEFFAGAAFLSYTGTQHVAYMRTPSACINDPVTTYLLTLEMPKSSTCPYVASPLPE